MDSHVEWFPLRIEGKLAWIPENNLTARHVDGGRANLEDLLQLL